MLDTSRVASYMETLTDGERAELIDGDADDCTPKNSCNLVFEIETFIRKNKGNCELLPAPFGVYIKEGRP